MGFSTGFQTELLSPEAVLELWPYGVVSVSSKGAGTLGKLHRMKPSGEAGGAKL